MRSARGSVCWEMNECGGSGTITTMLPTCGGDLQRWQISGVSERLLGFRAVAESLSEARIVPGSGCTFVWGCGQSLLPEASVTRRNGRESKPQKGSVFFFPLCQMMILVGGKKGNWLHFVV